MQIFRLKRHRFFYPAGLFSLVLLPLLGYFYIYSKPVFQQQYVKEVNYWKPEWLTQGPDSMPDPRFFRTYQKIVLTGATNQDGENLNLAQLKIRQILAKKDTINGIQIVFNPKAKYWSIVRGLDICLIENARTYFFYKNNLWVFYKKPKIFPSLFPSLSGCLITETLKNETALKPNLDFSQIAKSFWPAGILYIIMVSLTARKVVRQFRNQQLTTSNQQQ